MTYYIVRENATYRNCSDKGKFSSDISTAYYLIVSKSPSSNLFLVVFWFNFACVLFLLMFDVFIAIKLWKHESVKYENGFHFVILIIDKVLLKLWLSSTMAPPTYYASSFDYTKVCLEFESSLDTSLLGLIILTLFFPILGVLLLLCSWGFSCYVHEKCVWECRASDAIRWCKKPPSSDRWGTRGLSRICFYGAICYCGFSIAYVFVLALLLCVLMTTRQATRSEGVILIINAIL